MQGDLYVNGDSKLVERDVVFDGGVAFGVDKVLIPLGFGGNCDNIKETQITVISLLTLSLPRVSKLKSEKKSQISFCKIWKNK